MISSVCRALDGDGGRPPRNSPNVRWRVPQSWMMRGDGSSTVPWPLRAVACQPAGWTCALPADDGRSTSRRGIRRISPPPRQACSCWPRLSSGCTACGHQATVTAPVGTGRRRGNNNWRRWNLRRCGTCFGVRGRRRPCDCRRTCDAGVGEGGRAGLEFAGSDGGRLAGTRHCVLLAGRAEGCPGPSRQGPAPGSKLSALGPLSVVYKVLVDCATGDESHLADSSAALESFHDRGLLRSVVGRLSHHRQGEDR